MRLSFGGHDFILHPAGALLWPARHMVVVADLHLEKSSHFARRGYFLPPYDSRDTLQRLIELAAETGSRQIMVLGDGFHDNKGHDRLTPAEKILFDRLAAYDLLWIRGNHDSDFAPFGRPALDVFTEGGLIFRHEARASEAGPEITGHFHPKIEIAHKGGFLSCRCFIEDGRKLILPAFGAYAGGLAVSENSIQSLFAGQKRCYALHGRKVYLLPVL